MNDLQSDSNNSIDINLIELVNIAASVLDQSFVKAAKQQAKATFKTIKSGKSHHLGKVKIAGKLEPSVSLTLDYSEFRGPGFNFDVFLSALVSILRQLGAKFQAKEELNILSGENNSQLIHIPGVVKTADQFNVMVFAIELGDLKSINFRLMFVDPAQYDELNQKTTSENQQ